MVNYNKYYIKLINQLKKMFLEFSQNSWVLIEYAEFYSKVYYYNFCKIRKHFESYRLAKFVMQNWYAYNSKTHFYIY